MDSTPCTLPTQSTVSRWIHFVCPKQVTNDSSLPGKPVKGGVRTFRCDLDSTADLQTASSTVRNWPYSKMLHPRIWLPMPKQYGIWYRLDYETSTTIALSGLLSTLCRGKKSAKTYRNFRNGCRRQPWLSTTPSPMNSCLTYSLNPSVEVEGTMPLPRMAHFMTW